jgi:hypothetical protein
MSAAASNHLDRVPLHISADHYDDFAINQLILA